MSLIVGKKTLYLYNLNDPDNPIELAFQVMTCTHLTIGSCINVQYRVMEHAGSLESTKEV